LLSCFLSALFHFSFFLSSHIFLFIYSYLSHSFTHSLINIVCFYLIIYVFLLSCILSYIHLHICYWNICIFMVLCVHFWFIYVLIYSLNHLCIDVFINVLVCMYPLLDLSTRWPFRVFFDVLCNDVLFVSLIYIFLWFFYVFIHSFLCSFLDLCTCLFMYVVFIHSFMYSLLHLSMCSFIYVFMYVFL
jgi:hypothetical protein